MVSVEFTAAQGIFRAQREHYFSAIYLMNVIILPT